VHLRQRHREDDCEEDDLKGFVLRGCLEDALRYRVLQHPGERHLRLCELGSHVAARGAEVHSKAGLHDVHGQQADDESQCRRDLEVKNRAEGELADALHIVAVAGDADDERREQERGDQRLDHPEENGRQHLEVRRVKPFCVRAVGKEISDCHADDHRDEDPLRLRDPAQSGRRRP